MATTGEVRADDGHYELIGDALLARQARQTASRAGSTEAWNGTWAQAVLGVDGRRRPDERASLRTALIAARFAELREGVWLRPDNLPRPTVGNDVHWFDAAPAGELAELVPRLWDLDGWAEQAALLRRRMGRLVTPLEEGDRDALADGFVLSAAVLRHFQADPLLPRPLLPAGWPGEALREEYDRYDRAYRRVLRDWFDEQR